MRGRYRRPGKGLRARVRYDFYNDFNVFYMFSIVFMDFARLSQVLSTFGGSLAPVAQAGFMLFETLRCVRGLILPIDPSR